MKKLRLISFMLAFVMVVAMMVPALSILIAADGDTLPDGDTLAGWNIGWPNGAISSAAEATTDALANPNKDAAWAGAAYQLQALKQVATEFAHANATMVAEYKVGAIDGDNIYGFMLDVVCNGSNNNSAMIFIVEVDGVAYYNVGQITVDATAETPVYTGPATYFQGANGWTIVSNVCEEFTGAPAEKAYQRAVRLPKNYSGKLFIPLESLVATYAGPASSYNGAVVADAEALTAEKLASAAAVKVYALGTWNAPEGMFQGASVVYSTDWVAPMALPETLPSLDTPEHTNHNAYAGYVKDKYPSMGSIDAAIAGKDYTVSDNMLTETIAIAENAANAAGNQTVAAPILANKNVAGVLLRMRGLKGDQSNGNGISVGFRANGNLYIANTQYGVQPLARGNVATYLYDEALGGWVFYRDPGSYDKDGSHTTLRILGNMNGYAFIPIENFNLASDQAATVSYRQNTTYGTNKNVVADLETAGISEVLIGGVWGATVAVDEFYYVYVDGYSMTDAPERLPGDVVNAYNIGWPLNGIQTMAQSAGSINNALTNFKSALFVESDLGAGEAVADSLTLNGKFEHATKYTVEDFVADDTLGFAVDIDITGATANNGVIIALVVDDTAYYAVSWVGDGSTNFILEDGTSKWIAVNNKQYAFSEIAADNADLYQRAIRLPALFSGKFYAPLESFYTAYGEGGLADYNNKEKRPFENEVQLTAETLAAAENVELYAIGTWGAETIAFGNAAIVERGPYTELAPEGEKPTVLPAVENIIHRTDYNGNYWTEDVVADNAVTPIDEMWGATYAATAPDAIGENAWADFAGILLTVATTEKAAVTIKFMFDSIETKEVTNEDGTTSTVPAFNCAFSTAKGFGAKPIYLWQGGDKWAVEGAGDTFTIPANYTGYVYIPVTALTGTSGGDFSGFYKGYNSWSTTLFSDFVNEIGTTYTFASMTVTGVEATAELLWVDAISDAINNGDAEKPTNFPVNEETLAAVYGGLFNIGVEDATDAFLNSFTAFDAWGTAADPLSGTGNSNFEKTIGSDRIMPSKFNGATMLTESLVSAENAGATVIVGEMATMNVDGTPTINAATAAGLLFKINMPKPDFNGIGIDFGINVGGNVYRFFNSAPDSSVCDTGKDGYKGANGWIYMYNNFSSYTENTWTVTQGDSKIRIPSSFDGYVFVPFTLLKNGDDALDMNLLASAGITDVRIYGYWNRNPLTVESVEVASVPATLANSSITIGNDITLNASAIVTGTPTSVKANFILGENTVTVDGVAGENGVYTFALPGIGAHQMMDAIDIELVVDDAIVSAVNDYTIAEYAAKVLRAAGDENKVKKMAVDLLYYGDAVQNLLGYNTDNLATSVLTTEELDNRSNNMINKVKDEVKVEGAISENVQWKNVAVLPVDGGISVVFSAVVVDATDVTITVKKGAATETFAADKWGVVDNQYIVVYNNIGITELDTELTASFVKGTAAEGATLTASVNAVLAAIADKNSGASAAEKELAICLYALSNSLANFAK